MGRTKSELHYNSTGTLLKRTSNTYSKNLVEVNPNRHGLHLYLIETHNTVCKSLSTADGYTTYSYVTSLGGVDCVDGNPKTIPQYGVQRYKLRSYWTRLDKTTITETYDDETLTSEVLSHYDNPTHKQITSQSVVNSLGDLITTKFYYPQDYANDAPYSSLIGEHRIAEVVKTEQYQTLNGQPETKLSTQRTEYSAQTGTGFVVPTGIYTAKENASEEKRVSINRYDDAGHVLEISVENGMRISYIWGYDNTRILAKIENVPYESINPIHIQTIKEASNLDNDHCLESGDCSEKNLRATLNELRVLLPNAFVTSYTYDPMVGVTSITNPRGQIQYFIYDDFNRLKEVKDADGYILSENEYYYRPHQD